MHRRLLVTSALPYANDDIHIGHLVEYLQTDFWTRFQRMLGKECLYLCADDTHGTPIMIKARDLGIPAERLIEEIREKHLRDFKDFEVAFDHYGSTHAKENRELCESIFKKLEKKGHVFSKAIKQLYCEKDQMFLPDRFVKGSCPHCGAKDQYGDSCDVCSATYSPWELRSPFCALCKQTPVSKESEHLFIRLSDFGPFLKAWVPGHTSKEIEKKLDEWLKEDLRDWDISRDAPYFGFDIPGHPKKYFYVWVDAPIGYIASLAQWCQLRNSDPLAIWNDAGTEIYHFIGKDIVYFHTLFWPAMLKAADLKTPDQVFVHGFLTVNAKKMSKSKGTFIKARTYLNHLDALYLRYYFAAKLNAGIGDIDLNLRDFKTRVNSELVGKITNLASRGAQMLGKKLEGRMGKLDGQASALVKSAQAHRDQIAAFYLAREFSKVISLVREIADAANRYFDDQAPWKQIKDEPEKARSVLSAVLNVFRLLAIYLKPILPSYVRKVEILFNEEKYLWEDARTILEDHTIGPFEHLIVRIEDDAITAMVEESKAGKTS